MKVFLSDNASGVHPQVMEGLIEVNKEHAYPYGNDPMTQKTIALMKQLLDESIEVTFVMNGTGANVIGLSQVLRSYEGVICADSAHINVDECGAFEKVTGAKLLTLPHKLGKITPDMILPFLNARGNEHHNQPRAISISQVTEWGTVYTLDEMKALSDFAHKNDLYLHVDGARISNAAVALGCSLKTLIVDSGIDVLSFGGTKNGMMYGEAIVVLNKDLFGQMRYARKQGMQLASKMRYVSAQFYAFLSNDLWRINAVNANARALQLYEGLKDCKDMKWVMPVEANMLFVELSAAVRKELLQKYHFYVMSQESGLCRFVMSYDTTEEEVQAFIHDVKVSLKHNEILMD